VPNPFPEIVSVAPGGAASGNRSTSAQTVIGSNSPIQMKKKREMSHLGDGSATVKDL
jgi:hypothetical protein